MSVRSRRLHWTADGDPVLIIEAKGVHDVYRLAHHMQHGQVEFAKIGYRVVAGLKRKLGRDRSAWLMRYMHGDGGYR